MSGPDQFWPLYRGDELAKTADMSTAAFGAYVLIKSFSWPREGIVPGDDTSLARIARMAPEEWAAVRDGVLPHFPLIKDGMRKADLGKHRAEAKRIYASRKHASDVANAARRAASKRRKRESATDTVTESATDTVTRLQPQPQPQSSSDEEESLSLRSRVCTRTNGAIAVLGSKKPSRSEPEGFAEFYQVYPRKKSRGRAAKAYARAISDGATREELLAGARRYAVERCALPKNEHPKFTNYPATWLNDKGWLDEETPHEQRNGAADRKRSQFDTTLAGIQRALGEAG